MNAKTCRAPVAASNQTKTSRNAKSGLVELRGRVQDDRHWRDYSALDMHHHITSDSSTERRDNIRADILNWKACKNLSNAFFFVLKQRARPILLDSLHYSCGRDQMTPRERTIRATLLVRIIVGLLFCVAASSELPEILTLADQTDNDLAICSTSAPACPDLQRSQDAGCDQAAVGMDHPPSRTQLHAPSQTRSFPSDLLALHSVRRT